MDLPGIVLKKLEAMLPKSLMNDMTSFSFVPNDHNSEFADLVICTRHGEVMEFKDRNVTSSLSLGRANIYIKNIILHRRTGAKYFSYILQSDDSVFIITKDTPNDMILTKKHFDVVKVELEDMELNGRVKVKLWLLDDAIPVILDEDYCHLDDRRMNETADANENEGDALCLVLKQMLAEAKLNTAFSKRKYEEKKMFRHETMDLLENVQRFDRDGTKDEDLSAVDRLTVGNMWIRINNEKTVIGIPVTNLYCGTIQDVQLLLRCECVKLFEYITHIYTKTDNNDPPYWSQVVNNSTLANQESFTCLAVFDTPKFDRFANVIVNLAVQYICNDKSFCIPLNDVKIKAIDVVNFEYDPVLKRSETFGSEDLLSIKLTDVHKKLCIYPVDNKEIDFESFLIENLKFTKDVYESHHYNIFIHRLNPLNILHGFVLFYEKEMNEERRNIVKINVYARSENQILLFINLIYDQLPTRCAVLPDNFSIKLKGQMKATRDTEEEMETSQDMVLFENTNEPQLQELSSLLRQQMAAVVIHLEKCMEAMSEENTNRQNNRNANNDAININVAALGEEKYHALWEDLLAKMSITKDLL